MPGLSSEKEPGWRASSEPLSPKDVREEGDLCAELFRSSWCKTVKDWIDNGSPYCISLCLGPSAQSPNSSFGHPIVEECGRKRALPRAIPYGYCTLHIVDILRYSPLFTVWQPLRRRAPLPTGFTWVCGMFSPVLHLLAPLCTPLYLSDTRSLAA